MSYMRLLIAEDDPLLGEGLSSALGRAGFSVIWVRDGKAAIAAIESDDFSALVLDIGLPLLTGTEVLRTLRAGGSNLPVLMLTARDSTRDKVLSLDAGADDYLSKTVDMDELIARLRALIRRSSGGGGQLRLGELTLDLASHSVKRNGAEVHMSRREFDLLHALINCVGRVLTRSQLEKSIYGWDSSIDSNTI
jgi:DNA-binding response OmpR family regulator